MFYTQVNICVYRTSVVQLRRAVYG